MKQFAYKYIGYLIVALLGGFVSVATYDYFTPDKVLTQVVYPDSPYRLVNNTMSGNYVPDFTMAAEKTINSVVHVKTVLASEGGSEYSLFDFFFGQQSEKLLPDYRMATGSGVIISADGFIITNNHVIENSGEIQIILNDKRKYSAKLIGTDPFTDIALLKIDEEDLPFLSFGDSDKLKVGEWVLAVGNPFNLMSTVTAGIVSAKGRDIGALPSQIAIESFIQTDAVVNPGNSGGALVNKEGDLIGINTAIASNTGFFAGYSFAVPVSIARKVVEDLMEFGEVQRAMLGISIKDVDAEIAKQYDLDKIEGVLVIEIMDDGSASDAGLRENDVITKISDVVINNVSELQEQVSKYSPGEKVKVTFKRNNKEMTVVATLKNKYGGTKIVNSDIQSVLGAEFKELTVENRKKLNVEKGVEVSTLNDGKLKSKGMKEGFIITHINGQEIEKPEDVYSILKKATGGIFIKGIYPDGTKDYYAFGLK